MKRQLKLAAHALLASVIVQPLGLVGQGTLTPPGPPGPTMKSLDQLEPRTPIASAPFTIAQPGSYYLTTNLAVASGNAITIATNGVTLDLSGFTLSSTEVSPMGSGIFLNSGVRNITISNGHIQGGVTNNGSGVYSGTGFGNGIEISYSGTPQVNVLVSRVSVSGCLNNGIDLTALGLPSVVESCTVQTVGYNGIFATTVKQSSAIDCGNNGIDSQQASDCLGSSSLNGNGVYAVTAQNCYGVAVGSVAVYALGTAQNCKGYCTGDYGVWAYAAQNCYGYSDSSDGVFAYTAQNCYGYSASGSGIGVEAYNAENCYGYSGGSGYGVNAHDTAIGCYGYSLTGTGLSAFIANVCHGETASGTALSTPHNVNSY
jgi:hypothetical protein